MNCWIGRMAGIAALVLTTSMGLAAHPGSTTAVALTVNNDSRVDVTIDMDAKALLAKIESIASTPLLSPPRTREELTTRLWSRREAIAAAVDLRFDDTPVAILVASIDVGEDGMATVRGTGDRPSGARVVTWSTPLVFGAYPLAVRGPHATERVVWIQGAAESEPVALSEAGRWRDVLAGVWLGFVHILPFGLDHILFVLGLFLFSDNLRHLLLQVSAFTLAHSVTLGLSLYGSISLPSAVVEPLIALSVAYVGIENLFASRLYPWRVAVVFAFGLLHGMGFGAVLGDLEIAATGLLVTLIAFNVGVELGQLAVIVLGALALEGLVRARATDWRQPIRRVASATIGVVGLIWTVERLM
jgi:hypothetical protein